MGQAFIYGRSGGGNLGLNVFCQPTFPTTFEGVLLKTAAKEAIKKVVFDTNVWAAGQWQDPNLVADMPGTRGFACCAPVGAEIFIFGGRDSITVYSSAAIAYNPTTNTYRNLANMSEARSDACCVSVGDEIFIFGGRDSGSTSGYLRTAIAYNPTTNTYRNLADMPGTRAEACCALVGNEIFIFGGTSSVMYAQPSPTILDKHLRNLANMPGPEACLLAPCW